MSEEGLFDQLVRTPAAERPAVLDRLCAGDPSLRARLEELLAADAAADRTITVDPPAATAAVDPDGTRPADEPLGEAGQVVGGRYKLVEPVGEGGMGTVWMAQQTHPVKRAVAVKLVKAGMDSRAVLARFDAERQALALMDHPNIAKVLDAGATPDGRPYFVMELVKGVPITRFCDERRLTPRQRLELFAAVCDAVQHAHQKGVIHRDLKPGNVLVALYDDRPVPKVIDFGVAKATGASLTDHTLMTGFGAVVGTPEYMSPEQASLNNLDVDTRSDVYALGVLLYELLTGSTPVDRKSLGKAALLEVLRIVREVEAPRPSEKLSTSDALPTVSANRGVEPKALTGLLRGELDWVAMKALEKDRARRYETANAFAADVRRYLAGEAVQAHPPTAAYRVRKFVSRHKGPVLAAALLAAAVSVGGAGATGGMVWALGAEAQAKRDRDAAVMARGEATANELIARTEGEKVKAAREAERANQYLWDMQLLPLAFDKGTTAEVAALLGRHAPPPGEPDRRRFEWYYWNRRINSQSRTVRPEGDPVATRRSLWAASDDGTKLAVLFVPSQEEVDASPGPELVVWEVASGRALLRHRMPPPTAKSSDLDLDRPVFSGNGRRVAVSCHHRTGANDRAAAGVVQVLAVDSGKVLFEHSERFAGWMSEIALTRDGSRFGVTTFTENARVLQAWDVDTGKALRTATGRPDRPPVLGTDGETYLAVASPAARPAALGAVIGVTAAGFWTGERVEVRELATGRVRRWWPVPEAVAGELAPSPDGRAVAAEVYGSDVRLWAVASGEVVWAWPLPRYAADRAVSVAKVTYSPNGARVMVRYRTRLGAGDGLQVLDARTGAPLPQLQGLPTLGDSALLAFSPDGGRLAVTDDGVHRVWDVTTGKPTDTLRGHLLPVVAHGFAADGGRLWAVDETGLLKEWRLNAAAPRVTQFRAIPHLAPSDAAASPDGGAFALLAAGGPGETFGVELRDPAGGRTAALRPPPRTDDHPLGHFRQVRGVAVSSGGGRVAVACDDGRPPEEQPDGPRRVELIVWDGGSGETVFRRDLLDDRRTFPSTAHGLPVAVSPDGRRVAVGDGPAGVRVFDVDGGRERTPLPLAGGQFVVAMSWSPAGDRLAAVTGAVGGAARLGSTHLAVWKPDEADPPVVSDLASDVSAPIPSAFRAAFAWTPDGERFALSADTTFAVYAAATGRRLFAPDLPAEDGRNPVTPTEIAVSPDGDRLAGLRAGKRSRGDRQIEVWDAATAKVLLTLRPEMPWDILWGGFPLRTNRQLAFSRDGHRLLLAEVDGYPGGAPAAGRDAGFAVTAFDASPPPEPVR